MELHLMREQLLARAIEALRKGPPGKPPSPSPRTPSVLGGPPAEAPRFNQVTLKKLRVGADPQEQHLWSDRVVWLDRQGALLYHSIRLDRQVSLFDGLPVAVLKIVRPSKADGFPAFCFGASLPVGMHRVGWRTVFFSAEDEGTLERLLGAIEAFRREE